ncbi:MAG: hypothetical protein ABSB74_21510 [Tepidisphaeraceae bacterium]
MSTTKPPDQQSNLPAIRQPGDVEVSATGKQLVVRGSRHALAALSSALVYDPVPLLRPTVIADFGRASSPVRVLEAIRYFLALTEYRLGPNGWFRAWLFLWLRILLFVTVPLVFVGFVVWALVPVMMGVASVFGSLAAIAKSLEAICGSLLMAVVYLVATVLVVGCLFAILRMWAGSRSQGGSKFVESRIIR